MFDTSNYIMAIVLFDLSLGVPLLFKTIISCCLRPQEIYFTVSQQKICFIAVIKITVTESLLVLFCI